MAWLIAMSIAMSHQPLAMSRDIESAHRRERIAARDPLQRSPAAAERSVSRNRDFGVVAARRREAAPDAGARHRRRERALVAVHAGERDRLRVPRDEKDDDR